MGFGEWEVSGIWPTAVVLVYCSGATYPGHSGWECRGKLREALSHLQPPSGDRKWSIHRLSFGSLGSRSVRAGRLSAAGRYCKVKSPAFSKSYFRVSLQVPAVIELPNP